MKASITDRSRPLAQLIRQRSLSLLQSESPKVSLLSRSELHQRSREAGITEGLARRARSSLRENESPEVSLLAPRVRETEGVASRATSSAHCFVAPQTTLLAFKPTVKVRRRRTKKSQNQSLRE